MFGYAWSRVTVTLAEMFSMVMPSSSSSSERHREQQQQQQQPRHKYWHTASVTVTAALIAVVVALSCGICVVVAVLFRRRYDDYRANRGHNIMYGLGYGDGDEDIGESAAKTTTTTGQRKTETAQPTRNGLKSNLKFSFAIGDGTIHWTLCVERAYFGRNWFLVGGRHVRSWTVNTGGGGG